MEEYEVAEGGMCRGRFCSGGFGFDAGQADAAMEVHPVLSAALTAISYDFFKYAVPLGSGDTFTYV